MQSMWKLICENEYPHLLTIMVSWGKTNKQNKKAYKNDRRQVSVSEKKSLRRPIFSIE